jgi:Tfp pilus assembly protein PilZ
MGQWRKANTGLQKFPRVTAAVPVRVSTVDAEIDPDTGKTFFRTAEESAANLSRGGAFVHSWEPLTSGRRVVLTIDLPEDGELQLVGRVVWTRREMQSSPVGEPISPAAPGYGIEFAGGSGAELEILARFLNGLEPKSGRSDTRDPNQPSPPL